MTNVINATYVEHPRTSYGPGDRIHKLFTIAPLDKRAGLCYNKVNIKKGLALMIDKRIHYIIVVDTETCNGILTDGKLDLSDSLVYDLGFAVVDKKGRVYETHSYVIKDIFYYMADAMKSAYYASKIPQYKADIKAGTRKAVTFYEARKDLLDTMKKYHTSTIAAHNARFDYNALNVTQRYLTKSKSRYFFPYNVEIWDTLKMARQTIGKQKSYKIFCEIHNFMTKHKVPQVRLTAEILHRYLSGNENFEESHTGLEDVLIEKEILAHCFRQHKKMCKNLFEKAAVALN